MKTFGALLLLATSLSPALAQTVPIFGQCGGQGWTGGTVCAAGSVCVFQNPFYSQCLAGTSSVASTTSTRSTTTVSSTSTSKTSSSTSPAQTGFVKTSGTGFTLNGAKFTVVGSNAYWVGLMGYSSTDMNKAFADIAASGATVVRTWGFNDVTSSTISQYPIYYQSWASGKPVVNTGANGLQNFDQVIALAKANGLRVIVTLTNNWSDYGGMDVYVNNLIGQGQPHDLFYTNAAVATAYKNYVRTFVTRYLNEPTIMAWELANEPRCAGSTGVTTGNCTNPIITAWASQMSAFIKSIDSNHLVAIGDEGFINDPGNPSYPYQGTIGIDFAANLKITTLDFGTLHLYPDSWGQSPAESWGQQWITDHANMAIAANKPAILEEYGENKNLTVFQGWWSTVVSSGLAGDLYWQAGSILSNGPSTDDGNTIYPTTPAGVYTGFQAHAAALKKARGST